MKLTWKSNYPSEVVVQWLVDSKKTTKRNRIVVVADRVTTTMKKRKELEAMQEPASNFQTEVDSLHR
jgi:hypothetical protein